MNVPVFYKSINQSITQVEVIFYLFRIYIMVMVLYQRHYS